MKRIIKLITASAIALGMTGAVASAQSGCTISNTGSSSSNVCSFNGSTSVTYKCTNGVLVNTQTGQQANSGNATTSGNTGGGSATSGGALNEGQTTTNVNSSCAAASNTNASSPNKAGTSSTTSPTGGGRGAGEAGTVMALPDTGSVTVFMAVAKVITILIASVFALQTGFNAYRRGLLRNL